MKKLLSIVAIGTSLGACSMDNATPPNPAPPTPSFDALTLKRTACYGACPVYTVQILANGHVVFTGEDFVKVKGIRESNIPRANVELLAAALHHVKFEQLRKQYMSAEDGCVNMPTDWPAFSISVTKAGRTKQVSLYQGCKGPTIPAKELSWLADTIDLMGSADLLVN